MKTQVSRIARKVNDILNRGIEYPFQSYLFRRFSFIIVILDMLGGVFRSVDYTSLLYVRKLFFISLFASFIFFLEYLMRIWVAPLNYRSNSRWVARLRYAFSPFGVIDLLAILPFVVSELITDNESTFRIMEFTKLFLVFKLLRYSDAYKMISRAFYAVRSELIASYSVAGVTIVFSVLAIYYIEREAQPDVFYDVGQGFWWSIVAFTTTGFGDIVPVTPIGKLLGSLVLFVGITMIAIPTGILSSAFIEGFRRKHRNSFHKRSEDDDEDDEDDVTVYCPHCGKRVDRP